MRRLPTIGVILALSGLCLPLVLFPFAHEYNPVLGFGGSLVNMEIRLWETQPAPYKGPDPLRALKQALNQTACASARADPECHREYLVLPYRYPFALGVVVFFGGLGVILLASMRREE